VSVEIEECALKPADRADKRIVLLTGSPLCHNPRAIKEADALAAAGYQVEVLGAWLDDALAARDREIVGARCWAFTVVADLRCSTLAGRMRRAMVAARRRWHRTAFVRFGHAHPDLLGYTPAPLLRAAMQRDAALYIAHSEQALWVGQRLLAQGRCVGVDMEDWFSEDLLPEARRARPIAMLHKLEAELLAGGSYRTCTSHAMSDALAAAYRVSPPAVVYNVFPWGDRKTLDHVAKDRPDRSRLSVHWFSQTIGRGRGLEDLFAALPLLSQPIDLHLRGTLAGDWQEAFARWRDADRRHRVFVHPLVSNDELPSRIAEHDIGFAGEQTYCPSRNLTVTNKLFQYILSGLAVAASDTLGQREIARQVPEAIQLYPPSDARALADALNRWLVDAPRLQRAKQAALDAARERFCWEQEAEQVVRAADAAIFSTQTTVALSTT
jgi:glycosyltransferase involved in cell wall biosynthesis